MQEGIARKITGWLFIAAGVLFWGGWMALHTHIGQYFQIDDFPAVNEHLAYWISMFRVHIFGVVVTVLAIIAFGSMFTESPARVLIWPGVAVIAGGMFVWAAASAFYYHFGAWGGLVYGAKPLAERQALVDSLLLPTEYASCLVRFGHVFCGARPGGARGRAPQVAHPAQVARRLRRRDRRSRDGRDDGAAPSTRSTTCRSSAYPLWMARLGATILRSRSLARGERDVYRLPRPPLRAELEPGRGGQPLACLRHRNLLLREQLGCVVIVTHLVACPLLKGVAVELRRLGRSGLEVSAIGLGCNNFGGRIGAKETDAVVGQALDSGITLFDTADIYGEQRRVGDVARQGARQAAPTRSSSPPSSAARWARDPTSTAPRGAGSSARSRRASSASAPTGSTSTSSTSPTPATPQGETLQALDYLVKEGKVRYIGCSNFAGWQIAEATWISRTHGYASYISAQNQYNLLDRRIEREVIPACAALLGRAAAVLPARQRLPHRQVPPRREAGRGHAHGEDGADGGAHAHRRRTSTCSRRSRRSRATAVTTSSSSRCRGCSPTRRPRASSPAPPSRSR